MMTIMRSTSVHFSIILFTLTAILFTGCSPKVNVKALQPAKVDRMAHTKKIAVTPFQNDTTGLSGKIEAGIASKKLDGKRYFTTISRNDISKVLKEQKLQDSGLLKESTSVQLGELLGAQAIISGDVTTATSSDTSFIERRTKCADKKCKTQYEYKVSCVKRVVTLAAQVRILDVQQGDIIFADRLQMDKEWKHCRDDRNALPSETQALDTLSTSMANKFTRQLTPNYVNYTVTLLDDPEYEYSVKQKAKFEHALIYIEHKRYDKADRILSKLLKKSNDQCHVMAYDLAIVKEVQGELEKARSLYALADDLSPKPITELDAAILRIQNSIDGRKQAKSQMER